MESVWGWLGNKEVYWINWWIFKALYRWKWGGRPNRLCFNPLQSQNRKTWHYPIEKQLYPRGLIPLKKIFDCNDVVANPTLKSPNIDIEPLNISHGGENKLINLSWVFPFKIKEQYTNFLSKYIDVFACSYDDLNMYHKSIIKHCIPLKEGVKPFR